MNIRNTVQTAVLSAALLVGTLTVGAFAASDDPATPTTKAPSQGSVPTNPVEPTKSDKTGSGSETAAPGSSK